LELSADDREFMVEQLTASLEQEDEAAVKEAWDAEINRRVDEMLSGTAKMIPWDQVQADARHILAAKR
jgi:putative addiction module component (TIGR02574 family)